MSNESVTLKKYTPEQMWDYTKILLTEPASSTDVMVAGMLSQGAAAIELLVEKNNELTRLRHVIDLLDAKIKLARAIPNWLDI